MKSSINVQKNNDVVDELLNNSIVIDKALAPSIFYGIGLGLILLMAMIYISSWVGLLFNTRPGVYLFAIAAVVSALFVILLLHGPKFSRIITGLFVPLCIILAAGMFANTILDSSYDGLMYHQSAVLAIQSGWRPFFEPLSTSSLWLNHYPKASWVVGATFSNIFHSVEAMKAQNIVFIVAAWSLSFAAFQACLSRLHWGYALLFSTVVAANPVSIYQAMTGYNDGLLASQITCLVALTFLALEPQRRLCVVALALLIPYTVNLKFTATIYVIALSLGLFVVLFIYRMRTAAKFLAPSIIAGCIFGIFIFGIDPYITNFWSHGHPFYPVQGIGKVDIMTSNLPGNFVGKNYLYKMFYGSFGVPAAWRPELNDVLISIVPRLWYFLAFKFADVRVGGFGPILSVLVLLLIFGFATSRKLTKNQWQLIFVSMLLAVSGLINPEAWWARYVPQMWIAFAGLALVLVITPSFTIVPKSLGNIALCVMVLNSLSIGVVAGTSFFANDLIWRTVLASLAAESQKEPINVYFSDHSAVRKRLDSFGVRYTLVENSKNCKDGTSLIPQPNSALTKVMICKN